MKSLRMTDKWLAGLKSRTGERLEYQDAIVPGLRLRVGPRGKVWSCFATVEGERRRVTLGGYPEISLSVARKIADGEVAKKVLPAGTVAELVDLKLAALGDRPGSARFYATYLRSFANFVGHDKPARDVEPEDVVGWLRMIAATGIRTKHPKACVSAAFTTAMESDYDPRSSAKDIRFKIKANPATHVLSDTGGVRDRTLSIDELRHVWSTVNEPLYFKFAYRLHIAMGGLRVTETFHSRWEWYRDGWLHIPVTKNGTSHSVPVTATAADLLMRWRIICDDPEEGPLFPISAGDQQRLSIMSKMTRSLCRRHGIVPFQPRDIRRTMKTLLIDNYPDLNRDWIDVWHNHGKSSDVARKHYDRSQYETAKKAVAAAIDDLMDKVAN